MSESWKEKLHQLVLKTLQSVRKSINSIVDGIPLYLTKQKKKGPQVFEIVKNNGCACRQSYKMFLKIHGYLSGVLENIYLKNQRILVETLNNTCPYNFVLKKTFLSGWH